MDNLTPEQRKRELDRIAERERKRQHKIENFEKMSPEKRKELKLYKSRAKRFKEWLKHVNEPKPEEFLSEEQ